MLLLLIEESSLRKLLKRGICYAQNIGQIFTRRHCALYCSHADVGCKINKGGENEQIYYLKGGNKYVNGKFLQHFG